MLLGIAVALSGCAPAQQQALPPPAAVEATASAGCPASPLRARLGDDGTIRVVVVLTAAADGSTAAGRRAIADAQHRLLADLDGTHARVVRLFRYAPQLALVVDERALCRLLASPFVRSVQEDEPAVPHRPDAGLRRPPGGAP